MFTLLLDEELKELTVQGTEEFPFAIYHGGTPLFEKGYLDWHWHDTFEINMVTKGILHYYVEDQYYEVHPGEAVFINAGRLHQAYPEDSSQMSHTVVFDTSLFCARAESEWYQQVIAPFVRSAPGSILLTPDTPWMKEILEKLIELHDTDIRAEKGAVLPGYELVLKSLLCSIFFSLLNNCPYDKKKTASDKTEQARRMRSLLTYIAKHYAEPITLENLAAAASLSPSECSRFFTRQMKQSPFSYLIRYRIQRSCELLVQTDLPVSEVAMRVGFNSFSYYSKRFSEVMHCSPSRYRQKLVSALQPPH